MSPRTLARLRAIIVWTVLGVLALVGANAARAAAPGTGLHAPAAPAVPTPFAR